MLLCYFALRFGASVSIVLLLGQLSQSIEVCDLALKFANRIDERLQARHFLDIGLGAFAVAPEIGRAPFALRARLIVAAVCRPQRNLRSAPARFLKSSPSTIAISLAMAERYSKV